MRADYSRDRSVSLGSSRRWQRWQLRAAQCCRWFCGSPLWPTGPGTAELRRRYVEIGANYEGIITLQPHDRGIGDFFLKSHLLGEGGFGTVWKATPFEKALRAQPALQKGKGYALKRVKMPLRDAEIEMISKSFLDVTTDRMLQFLKVIGSPEATEQHVTRNLLRIVELPHTMHIAMELLEGPTLRDWMLSNQRLPEQTSVELTKQMLKAVHFLHRTAGALHRDITPQNFGFKGMPGEHLPPLQLFDMGLVYVLDTPVVESSAKKLYNLGLGGTMHWISPETWDGKSGACSDLWGIGLICHCLLLRRLPFGLQDCEDRESIWAAVHTLDWVVPPGASREGAHFLQHMLEKDPGQRLTSSEALQATWLTAPARVRPSVAQASTQRRVQLPREVSGLKERSFWQALLVQTSTEWSKPD